MKSDLELLTEKEQTTMNNIFELMNLNEFAIDSIMTEIIGRTKIGKEYSNDSFTHTGRKKLETINGNLLASIGVEGPKPPVVEVTENYCPKPRRISDRQELIKELEQIGLITWHFESKTGSHQYTTNADIAKLLTGYEIREVVRTDTKRQITMSFDEVSGFEQEPNIELTKSKDKPNVVTTKAYITANTLDERHNFYKELVQANPDNYNNNTKILQLSRTILNMQKERKNNNLYGTEIKGNPFIGKVLVVEDPTSMYYQSQDSRSCGMCYYNKINICKSDEAKKDFKISPEKDLIVNKNTVNLGNFCNNWMHYDTD